MKTRRLCIVSSEPFRCAEFLAALQMSLDPDDELEIILDRDADDHPSIVRDRHPHLDVALRTQGFFIVPDPFTDAPPDDRGRLESILDFESRREGRTRLKWLLLGLLGLILALLALWPAAKSFMSRPRLAGPPAASRMSESPVAAPAPAPPLSQTPLPGQEPSGSSPARSPERPESARSSESQDAIRSRDAETRPRLETARPREALKPLKPAPAPPPASPPPPAPARRDVTPSRFPGLPRVELIRQPAPGRGDHAYTVRVSDAAGRPVAGAEVSVLLSLPDGAVLDIPLDSGLEPGIYHGTAPPGGPAPVGLRVRVVTSDMRVEIPVGR